MLCDFAYFDPSEIAKKIADLHHPQVKCTRPLRTRRACAIAILAIRH
jgi:hypothetical protein